ncbi:MAG: phosphoglycerate dehydrogenase [Lachnospiraceae bacterium]|nr:phosphoglycerate dehydrogenase [Lachnospiraceae bacterium]
MKPKVAFPFCHHSTLVCQEAKQMLIDAGFELVCNDTGEKLSAEAQKAMLSDVFGIVAGTENYDADMVAAAKECKVIIRFGVGLDNFDLDAMRSAGIQVGVIENHNAVAEFALTLILGMLKNLPRYDSAVRNGCWSRFPACELSHKTVGIVGFGRIGMRLAELLSGFDTELLVYDPFVNRERCRQLGAKAVSMDELLASSDIVSLHLPATPETRHMINEETIGKMKDGAYLVNTSRGSLVDEAALLDALRNRKLSGAALDVYEAEPVKEDNPLFGQENTVLAPHVSALTFETNYNAGIISAQSIIRVLNGQEPLHPVK